MTRLASTLPASLPRARAVLELFKPVTWFPPMWAFACGVVSSGVAITDQWTLVLIGVLLAGPLICATSQAVNDWFDRDVDAINEPGRPIPSGRVPGRWGLHIAIIWTLVSLAMATLLGPWGFVAAATGLAFAWAYSAPPLRLKSNGWWGNAAVAASYEGLPWITGAAIMAAGAMPDARVLLVAALYSVGAHGIMTLNDFKSIEGDRRMGIGSLPVRLGVDGAARAACAFMLLPQLLVIAMLFVWDHPWHGALVSVLVVIQAAMMLHFLRRPSERARWYSALGVNFFVLGMLATAFALRAMSTAVA